MNRGMGIAFFFDFFMGGGFVATKLFFQKAVRAKNGGKIELKMGVGGCGLCTFEKELLPTLFFFFFLRKEKRGKKRFMRK